MTADPEQRVSSIDVLDTVEHTCSIGSATAQYSPSPHPCVDSGAVRRHVARAPTRSRSVSGTVHGATGNSMGRRIGWRSCWPRMARVRDGAWRY